MDLSTFEQYQASRQAVADSVKWLSEQDMCLVTLYNGDPLLVVPPNHVELQIVETDFWVVANQTWVRLQVIACEVTKLRQRVVDCRIGMLSQNPVLPLQHAAHCVRILSLVGRI